MEAPFYWTVLLTISIQFPDRSREADVKYSPDEFQDSLNKFCLNTNHSSCRRQINVTSIGGNLPTTTTPTPTPTTRTTTTIFQSDLTTADASSLSSLISTFEGNDTCPLTEKRCPQLEKKCIPSDISCSVINTGVECRMPTGYGMATRVLVCGDDTEIGLRCRDGDLVPVLTTILVQCSSSNDIQPRPIVALDVLNGPGDEGGAGAYLCSPLGEWEPLGDSPYLTQLASSCRDVGCGNVPQPSTTMPIFRRWAWVRAIYKEGHLHCTATLVASDAAVTAAHCVTRSIVSNQPEPDLYKFDVELPAPFLDGNTKKILVKPRSIHIHPKYSYNGGNFRHDIAIIFFFIERALPTVCVGNFRRGPPVGSSQLVFSLQVEQDRSTHGNHLPSWKYKIANWDRTCLAISIRDNEECIDSLRIQRSQFCANHPDLTITRGSSGGPYLAEIGKGLKESWVIAGVLSHFNNASSCSKDHSIYENVGHAAKWMKNCIYDRKCN